MTIRYGFVASNDYVGKRQAFSSIPGRSEMSLTSSPGSTGPAGYEIGAKTITVGVKKRRHPDSNRGIKVLQTSALPLGYGA